MVIKIKIIIKKNKNNNKELECDLHTFFSNYIDWENIIF